MESRGRDSGEGNGVHRSRRTVDYLHPARRHPIGRAFGRRRAPCVMAAIEGVEIQLLETRTDERGFFRELLRAPDAFRAHDFGQLSHSLMHTGVVKAWHVHRQQTDWWYV